MRRSKVGVMCQRHFAPLAISSFHPSFLKHSIFQVFSVPRVTPRASKLEDLVAHFSCHIEVVARLTASVASQEIPGISKTSSCLFPQVAHFRLDECQEQG